MKREPGSPFSQAATSDKSTPRTRRTERTSRILLKKSGEERSKGGGGGERRLPLLMIAGLEKALYRHRNTREKLAACGEDGLAEITVLQTSRRVKDKREGADCRVSRGILHREERSGAAHTGCTTSRRWQPECNWADGNVL